MYHDIFEPLREFAGRFGRRDAVGDQVEKKTASRRAACLGLVLAALTQASGCGSECDMWRDFLLTVELFDEDGVHLPSAAFAAAIEAATIEVCVDGLESYCVTREPDQSYEHRGQFEVGHSDLAYPKRLRCDMPSVRFTVEVPGCEPGEFFLAAVKDVTNEIKFDVHDGMLELVCPGA